MKITKPTKRDVAWCLLIITLLIWYVFIVKVRTLAGEYLVMPTSVATHDVGANRAIKEPVKESIKEYNGIASWYDYELKDLGWWSKTHDTCASRDLVRYSMARVTNVDNGKFVDCYVNDYIEHSDRIIDLSSHAFSSIADLSRGLIRVTIRPL